MTTTPTDSATLPGSWQAPDLSDAVALVTGASRGVGRGIAAALGDAGATVYVTGRSGGGRPNTEGLPGTVEETAELVTERGGKGIAVCCDHGVDEENQALINEISQGAGKLNVLVNNAWSGYERFTEEAPFHAPFWKQPMWRYDLFHRSLRGQFSVSRAAAPLLMESGSAMLVNISFTDGDTYLGQTPYDVSKNASDRMVVGMAYDMRRTEVSALALHPGFVRTERVEAAWSVVGEGPAQVAHSPEYVGRAIAELAGDPGRSEYNGKRVTVGDLAQKYAFHDVDDRQPPPFRLEGTITLAARMQRLARIAEAESRG